MNNESTNQMVTETDVIGIIGSPSSNNSLSIDVLGSAVSRKLIGELAYFKFIQSGKPHFAIGQITEVKLNNIMLEDATMKSLVREKGNLETVSGVQDTYRGELTISAVFGEDNKRYFPSMLGTVPPTGTPIHIVTDSVLETILAPYRDMIIYLGKVYGSTPRLPLWFKHFGTGENGAGEAYHIGIFGKTGSGKSVLAKTILLSYARHPEMTLFVIDPQAEFSMDVLGETRDSRFDLKMKEVLTSFKKQIVVKNVNDLILQGWDLFTEVIRESNFFHKIGIKNSDEKQTASEDITLALKGKYKTTELVSKDAFFDAFKFIGGETANKRFQSVFKEFSYNQEKFDDLYVTSWKPVCELFRIREGGITIGTLLQKTLNIPPNVKRPIVIINLSGTLAKGIFWNDAIQALVTKSFLENLKTIAELSYRKNQFLNSLVILDEAHRLAPSKEIEVAAMESVRLSLIDAVRTTRKYGLGWLFISQTLASLPKEIVEQMRILFFGFGLAFGNEFNALKEIAGGEDNSLKLYQSFRDPHSAFDALSKKYNFMSIGPVSPLSFAGTPLFFTAFSTAPEFLKLNRFA